VNRSVIATALFLGSLLAVPASAADLTVGPSGQFSTIQAAVDVAQAGDRILVASGEYAGAQVNKAVEIRGTGATRIVTGPPHPSGLTFGFLIGALANGAGGDGVTIAQLTFAETVELPVYSKGANDVTVSHNLFLNAYQGITNRGGSRWNISHNTFQDLRASDGGGIAIMVGDGRGGAVQDNVVAYNHISGTLHVSAGDGGGYSGTGIALFADFRFNFGQTGASSIAGNRVVNNSVSVVSDNPTLVDVVGFDLQVGVDDGGEPSDYFGVIHDNVIGFNDFKGMAQKIQLTPTDLGATNSLWQNLGGTAVNRGGDFDGDGRTDVGFFRPSDGMWHINSATPIDTQFGDRDDIAVPGDYDGDGKTDIAVFRPSNGIWFINGALPSLWGTQGDIPVPADYDGDGKTDLGVFRPSEGVWYIFNRATGNWFPAAWGTQGDIPVPADYDGDGKTDLGVFRPSEGVWYIFNLATGKWFPAGWGAAGDVPVPADYDGDGRTDLAVFRPSDGIWYIFSLATGKPTYMGLGIEDDVPVPGDYDGDGKTDIAVFRPSDQIWYIVKSTDGKQIQMRWGTRDDVTLPRR